MNGGLSGDGPNGGCGLATDNARVERLRPWRIAQLPDGIFTVTKGSGFTLLMTREEAEHVVAHLGLLLKLDQETP